jgi:hypothetical protein
MSTDPLPRGWTRRVRSSVLHAISLATAALTVARARAGSEGFRTELERAEHEIALLREELDLKDSRWIRLSPRRRPHYTPVQRMRILQLKAARNWSCEQAAEALMIDEQTLKSWLRRVDEEGEHTLVQLTGPVNRFPDYVRYLVRQLKALCPTMGKVRIAQTLARAGLHLSVTTVGRVMRESAPIPDDVQPPVTISSRRVTARNPGDLWHRRFDGRSDGHRILGSLASLRAPAAVALLLVGACSGGPRVEGRPRSGDPPQRANRRGSPVIRRSGCPQMRPAPAARDHGQGFAVSGGVMAQVLSCSGNPSLIRSRRTPR